eukprot:TRINITY_DN32104_c0_g1_i1.p1 TRINITY_DN32104_c0_g1~~TRINITY_DN32104_c0_g1_i1.p1  ORF type:complete len:224 (+),score=50.89 TRINITY_DN32104_c0_g1_i1:96-674(+)
MPQVTRCGSTREYLFARDPGLQRTYDSVARRLAAGEQPIPSFMRAPARPPWAGEWERNSGRYYSRYELPGPLSARRFGTPPPGELLAAGEVAHGLQRQCHTPRAAAPPPVPLVRNRAATPPPGVRPLRGIGAASPPPPPAPPGLAARRRVGDTRVPLAPPPLLPPAAAALSLRRAPPAVAPASPSAARRPRW